MDFLKELFNDGALTYEQFSNAVSTKGFKLADLSTGNYVSKSKYDNDIATRDNNIQTLNSTLTTRDTDLADIQKKLADASADKDKLTEVTNSLTSLRTKYDTDTQNYQKQLSKQAYEFAVKEFANGKKFTSNAAKRDFINSMIAKELTMDSGKILGADDFVTSYTTDNSDAFVVENAKETETEKIPQFVDTTPGSSDNTTKSPFDFNFTGVRKH